MDLPFRGSFSTVPSRSVWRMLKPTIFSSTTTNTAAPRSTAHLDGLRGLAAFLVYVTHHIGVAHDFGAEIATGFGRRGNYTFLTIPFLRVLFTGSHFAVSLFFVISGFVLAHGPLRMIHARQGGLLSSALSSAIFRRGIRLWLPVFGTTFAYMLIRHIGVWADYPQLQPTMAMEIRAYFTELWRFTYFLRIHQNPFVDLSLTTFSYNPHTWTIALEYQGSILLFIVLLALADLRTRARILFMAALSLYFILHGGWVPFCFLSGALIAEVHLLRCSFLVEKSFMQSLTLYVCLFAGLWFASMPTVELRAQTKDDLAQNPGWAVLASWVPSTYEDIKPFWLSWGAVGVVFAINFWQSLREWLEIRPLQYLGRISFAFYLVHGPILQVVGVRMYHITGQRTDLSNGWLSKYDNWIHVPHIGPFGLELSFLAAHLVILPINLYCAELVEQCIDVPSVRFARWCYQSVVVRDHDELMNER